MKPIAPANSRVPSGVTLIETLLTIFVLILLALAVGEMSVAAIRFFDRQSAATETQRSAGIGIEPIREAAKGANTIVAGRTINGIPYQTSSTTIIFELPTIDSAGNLVSASSDYVAFALSSPTSTLLVRHTQAATGSARFSRTDTIAPFVGALRFRYNTSTPAEATAVEIYLESAQPVQGLFERTPVSTLIRLQNK